ncbi:MAG: tRNA (N6-threonylcarbamoyladenosine(37)-N6)-methyltransferase TrmO [Desulfomonile tiedjei]|nr:tRNA (N6-threonylcarbamoyladenosine(37)-N6)-methyltransferase TrmO [Desulfomonile tiedjei]
MRQRFYALFIVLALLGCAPQAMAESYSMQPVGRVVKNQQTTVLEIFPRFRDALLGLEQFSHVMVFYWFDRNDSPDRRTVLRVHPRGDTTNPLTGVFATRSPFRPNLIGFSVCRIGSVEHNRITVDRIDAFDGTPIVDLKPYIPSGDCVPDASVPEWVKRIREK